MTNQFESEVSHILNQLVINKKILYYYKFIQNMQTHILIADHIIVSNSGKVIFIECKSTKYNSIDVNNVFKEHQVKFNNIIANHYFFFAFYRNRNKRIKKSIKQTPIYFVLKDINQLKPKNKSIKVTDFNAEISSLKCAIDKILVE